MNQSPNIDVLVVSCDSYSDVWDAFFNAFFNAWKDCPLDIYLLTNQKSFSHLNVKTVKIGLDLSWSDNVLNGLEKLKNDYVLLMIEDLILKEKISMTYFNQLLRWIKDNKPNYLRLCNSHPPKHFDTLVGSIPDKTPYKTSTMPCVWRIDTLKKILKSGESAWDFEIKGSLRAYQYGKFFAVHKTFINYHNSIIKGKWRRTVLNDGFGHSVDIQSLSRPIMSTLEESMYALRKIRSSVFNYLPNELKLVLKG
jgi:hypothetical protein